MKIITTQIEIDQLKSRELITLECIQCNKYFYLAKNRFLDSLSRKGLNGSFCSIKCGKEYKTLQITRRVNCLNCSNVIQRTQKQIKKSHGNSFCCQSCSARYFNNLRPHPKGKCPNCQNDFLLSGKKQIFCSKNCLKQYKGFKQVADINLICTECSKSFLRKSFRVNKRPFHFCSRSCQARYANKTWNRTSRFGVNKSKAETEMVQIIKKDFPNLEIIENDRKILNGLELDIYIPSKNIGIELNGPCHYIPIFGGQALAKTQSHDVLKKQTMQELKIHFFQINIMGAGKRLPIILSEAYQHQIKPLL